MEQIKFLCFAQCLFLVIFFQLFRRHGYKKRIARLRELQRLQEKIVREKKLKEKQVIEIQTKIFLMPTIASEKPNKIHNNAFKTSASIDLL
jgi:hypothetical protein